METAAPLSPLVLVVDDFQDNREMFAEFLILSGFRVAQAATGPEALDRAFALLPDVILMDLSLPELDGWEATRRLKGDARTRHIPVVALTGHVLADHSRDAREAGCDAFLTKPCLPEALVVEVQRALAGHHGGPAGHDGGPSEGPAGHDGGPSEGPPNPPGSPGTPGTPGYDGGPQNPR